MSVLSRARVLLHGLHEHRIRLAVGVVHLLVGGADAVGQRRVAVDEGVEALLEHRLGLRGHLAQVEGHLVGLEVRQELRALGDVHGQVADALQVAVHLQDGDDEAQVAGHTW